MSKVAAALVVASSSELIRCNVSFALFSFLTTYLGFQFSASLCDLDFLHIISNVSY